MKKTYLIILMLFALSVESKITFEGKCPEFLSCCGQIKHDDDGFYCDGEKCESNQFCTPEGTCCEIGNEYDPDVGCCDGKIYIDVFGETQCCKGEIYTSVSDYQEPMLDCCPSADAHVSEYKDDDGVVIARLCCPKGLVAFVDGGCVDDGDF